MTRCKASSWDNLTMAAVQQVCKFNPELTFYENGVSWELIWRWNGMVKPALITPNSMDFHMGDEHERIEQIQNRLNALGYDEAGYSFAQGIYDDAFAKNHRRICSVQQTDLRPQ